MYVMHVCTDHAWHDPLLAVSPPQLRGGVAAEGEDVPGLGEAGRVLRPQRHRDDLLLYSLQLGRHQGLLHLACKWCIQLGAPRLDPSDLCSHLDRTFKWGKLQLFMQACLKC